jgi:hypothetical protein
MYLVVFYVGEYVWVCGYVYKIENFRTLSAPSEIASLREAISSSAAFEKLIVQSGPCESNSGYLPRRNIPDFKIIFYITSRSLGYRGTLKDGQTQRQETLDLPYLTLLCDNLKNRMFLPNFFSRHYFENFLTAASYRHHSTGLSTAKQKVYVRKNKTSKSKIGSVDLKILFHLF